MAAISYPLQPQPSHATDWATMAAAGLAVCLLGTAAWLGHNTLQGVTECFALDDTIAEAQSAALSVRSTLKDAETGQRGYLLTHDRSYLAPYTDAQARIGRDLAVLDRASLGDPDRKQRIGDIRELAAAKMGELAATIAAAESGHTGAAIGEVRTNVGRDEMDAIRADVDALEADAAIRVADARLSVRSLPRWAGTIGLSLTALMLMGWIAVRQRTARLRATASVSSLDRLTRAFDLTPGIMLDLDGRIVFWGLGAERLYGYGHGEAMGQIIHVLLRTEFHQQRSEIQAALMRDGHWSGELEQQRRDGIRISVASQWSLHRGEADIIIKVDNDITGLKRTEASLRDIALTLRLALAASGQGVWHWTAGPGTGDLECDAHCKAMFDVPPDARVSYAAWIGHVHPEDRAAAKASLASALDPNDPDDDYASEYRMRHTDGKVRWLESSGRAAFEAATDAPAQRRATGMTGTIRDVSAMKLATRQRDRAAALLRTIIETVPGLIYAKDRQGRMLVANRQVIEVIGKPWREVEGRTTREILYDQRQAEAIMRNDLRIVEQGLTESEEEPFTGRTGQAGTWLSTKTPLRGAGGEIIGLVGLSVEITERKRLEDQMRLMINELNHRVKNTLVTIQAITRQTLAGIDPEIREVLEQRLLAVASAHDILTRESWEGAGLEDVVTAVLVPFHAGDPGCFRISGPALQLCPRAALALAMGLHELATNALKYGALSIATGAVEISWEVTATRLCLTWAEIGGPPVVPPARRGFGIRLIERALAQDLGGKTQIYFDHAAGVTCHIDAPLAQVAMTAAVLAFPRVGMNG